MHCFITLVRFQSHFCISGGLPFSVFLSVCRSLWPLLWLTFKNPISVVASLECLVETLVWVSKRCVVFIRIQIKVWEIPDGGLFVSLTDWLVDLHGHSKRVNYIEWHPTAENILLSSGADFKVNVALRAFRVEKNTVNGKMWFVFRWSHGTCFCSYSIPAFSLQQLLLSDRCAVPLNALEWLSAEFNDRHVVCLEAVNFCASYLSEFIWRCSGATCMPVHAVAIIAIFKIDVAVV